jgi:5-methylcytosine-specific restriction endonuclease McrA
MSTTNSYKASKVAALIRQLCSYYHQPRKEAKEAQKRKKYLRKKDGTLSKKYLVMWECEHCNGLFEKVDLDHKIPVGKQPPWPYDTEELLDYIRRILAPREQFQCLCRGCHKAKTLKETKERARKRRNDLF